MEIMIWHSVCSLLLLASWIARLVCTQSLSTLTNLCCAFPILALTPLSRSYSSHLTAFCCQHETSLCVVLKRLRRIRRGLTLFFEKLKSKSCKYIWWLWKFVNLSVAILSGTQQSQDCTAQNDWHPKTDKDAIRTSLCSECHHSQICDSARITLPSSPHRSKEYSSPSNSVQWLHRAPYMNKHVSEW